MRRLIGIVCAVFLLALLPGCDVLGLDVETQLRPPRPVGEQEEIQKALEAYLATDKSPGRYILKYPKQGEYRSAFLIEDFDGDGVEEAVAFYSKGPESSKTHLNLLKKKGDTWRSVSDIEGYGTDIDRVMFADLSGDGQRTLLAGWNQFSSRDRQLMLYQVEGEELVARNGGIYTDIFVGDITASGRDEILLLSIASAKNQVSAVLKSLRSNTLTEIGRVSLDGYIQQFGSAQIGKLADAVNGLYIDCFKTANTMMTELIYWDGKQLVAPFYNATENVSKGTLRETTIPSMDVDGDGTIEWPQCSRLPGYATADAKDAMWRTDWYSYQYNAHEVVAEFSSIVNTADNYYLKIGDDWFTKQITATYQPSTHTLTLTTVDNQPFLALRATYIEQQNAASTPADGRRYQVLDTGDQKIQYSVWFDANGPFSLNLEKVGYMLTLLSR